MKGPRAVLLATRVLRAAAIASLAAAALAATSVSRAQPARPIVLVVPAPPGGNLDFMARQLAGRFEAHTGQKLTLEYRIGAGGYVGSAYVARSAPDGQMLVVNLQSSLYVLSASGNDLIDLGQALVPVAVLGTSPQYLLASAAIPVRNARELVAYARKNPNKLNFASVPHTIDDVLYTPKFQRAAAIELVRIPYNGSADVARGLLSGEVHLYWTSVNALFRPLIDAGKIVALGAKSAERSELLPEVPTIREQGVDFDGSREHYTVFGPAGLPGEVVSQLNRNVYAAMNRPEVRAALLSSGTLLPRPEAPAALAAQFAREAKEAREAFARIGSSAP